MLAFERVSTHHIQRMRFSDIPRVVAVVAALLPSVAWAQSDADPDEPTADEAPASPPAPTAGPPATTPAETTPPIDPATAGAVEVIPPAEQGPATPADAAMSWTALGAQQVAGDSLVTASFGFAALPMATYHYAISDSLAIGVAAGLDYGRYVPDSAFDAAPQVAFSMKMGLPVDQDLRLGLRGDLGVFVPSSGGAGVLIDLSANLLAPVAEGLYAGAGVDVPLSIRIHDNGSTLVWPLLFGGVAEYRILAPLSIFAEAKAGPAFIATSNGGVYFALKLLGGLAYRL